MQDDARHVTGAVTATVTATGADIVTTGSTYSSTNVPRCCPDGTFTSRWRWKGQAYVPS